MAKQKKLRAYYTEEEECIGDIKRRFKLHTPGMQQRLRVSASQVIGSTIKGFFRGRASGVHDAFRTIHKAYPKAAAALREAYGLNKDGE